MMTDKGVMDIVELKALLVSSDDSWGFKSLRACQGSGRFPRSVVG